MAAINFPDSPSLNEQFTSGDSTWKWDGSTWSIVRTGVIGPTGPTGPTGPGADTLNELTDVTLTSPQDGHILVYNASTSQWVNLSTIDGGTP